MKDEKDKLKVFSASEIGKDEMNLVEFPITLLSKRHTSDRKTIKFSDTILGEDNQPAKREWIVTGSDEFGLPLAYDNDILLALLVIGKETNFDSRKIHFTRYQLCQILGWERGGNKYKRIEEALDRLKSVSIKAKNAFWDNERKGYVTKNFGIIDDYELFDSPKSPAQDSLPFSYVNLSEHIYNSIQAGYIKNIDIKIYFGLESVVSKRLYRYLDKKKYGKKKFEINIFTLARSHLGLAKCKFSSQIKEKLTAPHEELIEIGFLKTAEYMPTADGLSEKVVYTFGTKTKIENFSLNNPEEIGETRKPSQESVESPEQKILKALLEVGVTASIARQLVNDYPLKKIEMQIKALPYRSPKNPAGMLVLAIQGDWAAPAEYAQKIKKEQEIKIKKQHQEKEEKEKAMRRQQVEEHLASLTEDEMEQVQEEARQLAIKEGGSLFVNREIPEFMLKSYIIIVIQNKLGI